MRIGLTLGLTGKYAAMSDMQMKGFRIWEREINARGGLLGRPVEVIIYDDRGEPGAARSLYELMIEKQKVDFVFGPYSSAVTEAVIPVTEGHGYPLLVSGASADSLWEKGSRRTFGVQTPASKNAVSFLELLVQSNLDRIAVVYADDVFSRQVASGTVKWARRLGLGVVLFEGFQKGSADLAPLLERARNKGARVLILCGHLDESVSVRRILNKIAWQPSAFFASVGPTLDAYRETLQDDADLTFSSSQWEHDERSCRKDCLDFFTVFKLSYGRRPSYHAATAYAAGRLLEEAVKITSSLDRDRLASTFSSMDTVTILGRYAVDRRGMQTKHFNVIVQWQKGRREVVWPKELQTSDPVFRKQ